MAELWETLENIADNAVTILKAAKLGALAVNYGDRQRVDKLRPPVLWVMPMDSSILQEGHGENWVYRFTLAAVIEDTNIDKGRKAANKLAAQASAVLVRSHTLDGIVRDVRRVQYLPGDVRGMTAKQLHAAGYVMEARFRHLDREET